MCCLSFTQPPSSPEFVDSPVNIPYPPLEEEESAKKTQTSQKKQTKCKKKSKKLSYEPKYSVLYRGEVDMLDFAVNIGSEEKRGDVKRPKEIVVTVELPLMVSWGMSEEEGECRCKMKMYSFVYM